MNSIIDNSSLTTISLETYIWDANSIKKARYTIQVVSCTLYKLLMKVFNESSYSDDRFDEWLKHMKKNTSSNIGKKLELALPKIWQFLESVKDPDVPQGHKEQSAGFIQKFVKDVTTVEFGFSYKPFAEKEFKKMNSNIIFPQGRSSTSISLIRAL